MVLVLELVLNSRSNSNALIAIIDHTTLTTTLLVQFLALFHQHQNNCTPTHKNTLQDLTLKCLSVLLSCSERITKQLDTIPPDMAKQLLRTAAELVIRLSNSAERNEKTMRHTLVQSLLIARVVILKTATPSHEHQNWGQLMEVLYMLVDHEWPFVRSASFGVLGVLPQLCLHTEDSDVDIWVKNKYLGLVMKTVKDKNEWYGTRAEALNCLVHYTSPPDLYQPLITDTTNKVPNQAKSWFEQRAESIINDFTKFDFFNCLPDLMADLVNPLIPTTITTNTYETPSSQYKLALSALLRNLVALANKSVQAVVFHFELCRPLFTLLDVGTIGQTTEYMLGDADEMNRNSNNTVRNLIKLKKEEWVLKWLMHHKDEVYGTCINVMEMLKMFVYDTPQLSEFFVRNALQSQLVVLLMQIIDHSQIKLKHKFLIINTSQLDEESSACVEMKVSATTLLNNLVHNVSDLKRLLLKVRTSPDIGIEGSVLGILAKNLDFGVNMAIRVASAKLLATLLDSTHIPSYLETTFIGHTDLTKKHTLAAIMCQRLLKTYYKLMEQESHGDDRDELWDQENDDNIYAVECALGNLLCASVSASMAALEGDHHHHHHQEDHHHEHSYHHYSPW